MKERTACFTGHRRLPWGTTEIVRARLKRVLIETINEGYRYFGAGGALGFDTIAAQTVLDLKKEHPEVKLILVLPCETQADRWSDTEKEVYEGIKRQADKLRYISREYTRDCMFQRNRHLVDNSSLCICYLSQTTGGTAYTVDYARHMGLKIINVAQQNKER